MNRVQKVQNKRKIQHVLMSLSDKSGLEDFVQSLLKINPELKIYSTGGTYKALEAIVKGDKNLVQVSSYTGQPEMQGGLVKTLDYKIYLGLLNETFNPEHQRDLQKNHGVDFDMVVVNLYPFTQTIQKTGTDLEDARSNIDIGGPTMLRASAKNYLKVASVCDPQDYGQILHWLKENQGALTLGMRFHLAKKTFEQTSAYDQAISEYLLTQEEAVLESIYTIEKEGV